MATAAGRCFVLQGREELAPVRAAWSGLARSPIQALPWLDAWLATLGREWEPRVVVLGDPEDPAAVAPLAAPPGRGRPLELMSVGHLSEPLDLLARDDDALARLGRALVALRRPFLLRRVAVGSPAAEAIVTTAGRLAVRRPARGYTVVPLDGDPFSRMGARARSDLRRKRRRLEELGDVEVANEAPGPEEADAALDAFVAVEARSWKGAAGTALARDPGRASFYRAYFRAAAALGILRTTVVRAGGRVAAMNVAVEHEQRLWALKIGFDAAFARASPGLLVTAEAIEDAAARGLRSFEFLGALEEWTRAFGDDLREFESVRYFPPTFAGMSALARDGAAKMIVRG